jgi:hypothetical protein
VFLWRPAAEVVASCLHQPPPWAGFRELRELLALRVPLLEGTSDPGIAPAELFSRMWNATVRAGLDLAADLGEQAVVISYDDLRADPVGVGGQVARLFGLPATKALADVMGRAAGHYSKDLSGRTAFDPRGAHARPALSSAEHALVARLTALFEREIRSR